MKATSSLSRSRCTRPAAAAAFGLWLAAAGAAGALTTYPLVDTGQTDCYDDGGQVVACPGPGEPFYGQDAQHVGRSAHYRDNGDGTVSDFVTGLMWQQTPIYGLSFDAARAAASSTSTGGYTDWRLPTIKELYSLIDFRGETGASAAESTPYLDTRYFDFQYGDTSAGERFIDAQYVSSTEYVSSTMWGDPTVFGVNFADGRIKGYGLTSPGGGTKTFHVRYVRGGAAYGENDFRSNNDGTITDRATGLMWSRLDSGAGMDWEAALAWAEARNAEQYLGYSDWRLPDAKELQSLVDYTRSPDTTASAAISPFFATTRIAGDDYPYFWTSTSHLDGPPESRGDYAVYVAFGRALGYMETLPGSGSYELLDVHGAGAQRSDPKSGDASEFPYGHGPQGDVVRIESFVRLVRDVGSEPTALEAAFEVDPVSPVAGATARFEDRSAGSPDGWHWDFGDGATSSEASPDHTFELAGSYPVELTVSRGDETDSARQVVTVVEAQGCATAGTTLCLLDRFRVEVAWTDFEGESGDGQAVPLTSDTGAFWFFRPANLELMVKVLDGRSMNDCYWVFYGALSTVEYTVTVADSVTGSRAEYTNPSGALGSRADTSALCGL